MIENKSFLSAKEIAPFHGLTLIFLSGLILLTLFFRGQIPLWQSLFLRYVSSVGLLFVIKVIYDRDVMGRAVGYLLFPAIGPRYALTHLQTIPLEGSFITDWVRDGLNALEHNKRDVMPSGHTQIALIVLYLAYRYERIIFCLFVPIVAGLILSTIYLRYHYIVDLFAGGALAIGCMVLGPHLFQWWSRFNDVNPK